MTSALRPTGSTRRWRQIRERVLARDGGVCRYCGDQASEVHHVTPRTQGGTDDDGNLVAACRPCNLEIGVSLVIPDPLDTPALSYPSPGPPPYQRPPALCQSEVKQ